MNPSAVAVIFGRALMAQSMSFLAGISVDCVLRMRKVHSYRLIPVGLAIVLLSVVLMPLPFLLLDQPSISPSWDRWGSIASVWPSSCRHCRPQRSAPFRPWPAAAASLGGFLQMVTGLLGGIIASLLGESAACLCNDHSSDGPCNDCVVADLAAAARAGTARVTVQQTNELPPLA